MVLQGWIRLIAAVFTTGMFLFVGPLAFAADELSEVPDSYELGKGYRLGDSNFTVGGYSAVQYQNTDNAGSGASLTHLSMFLWWENQSRVKFFSEFDRERETASVGTPAKLAETHFLAVERFYLDYSFSDLLNVRAGKFLTPIGRWNLTHADPLVWTTSRPLVTHELYPDNATGLMLFGNAPMLGRQAEYALYASSSHDLRTAPGTNPFSRAYGARINLPANENLEFGVSYLNFNQRDEPNEDKHLLGLDFLWSVRGYELSGELAHRTSNEGRSRDVKGGFIQGVIPLSEKLFAVGRLESMRDPDLQNTVRLNVVGLNYRLNRAVALKLELIHGSNTGLTTPVGFLSSISVLF